MTDDQTSDAEPEDSLESKTEPNESFIPKRGLIPTPKSEIDRATPFRPAVDDDVDDVDDPQKKNEGSGADRESPTDGQAEEGR